MKIMTVGPVDPVKLKETVASIQGDPVLQLKGIYEKRSPKVFLSESTFYLLKDRYRLAAALEAGKPLILFAHKVLFKNDIEDSDAASYAVQMPDSTFPISIRRIINTVEWTGTQYDATLFQYTLKKVRY